MSGSATNTSTTRTPWDQPFSSSSVWNVGIGSSAVWGSGNDADVAQLRSLTGVINAGEWSQPIYVGTASDPLVTITVTDQTFPMGPQQVHVPISAVPALGTDRHMAFFDTTNPTKMWSFCGCTFNNGKDVTGGITAVLGGVFDDTGDAVTNTPGNGNTEYDFAVGTINDYDLTQGVIRHALRFSVSANAAKSPGNTWLSNIPWPDVNEDYNGPTVYTGNINYGSTIGIPANVNLNSLGLSQGGMMVAKALQTYGAIMRDTGGTNQLTLNAVPDAETNPLLQEMRSDMAKIEPYLGILRNQGPNSINGGGTSLAPAALPLSLGNTPTTPPATGAPPPVTVGSGSDSLVITVDEDAYQGDAQFTVSVDGKQLGGTQTTTALHSASQTQAFTFKGDWAAGQHSVAVSFLNDAYGGTPTTDRNLYVTAMSYDGTSYPANTAALTTTGTSTFNVTDTTAIPATPPSAPALVTVGSGNDSLVVSVNEDAYQGNAQFTVSVDGTQVGGTQTTTALHSASQSQAFTFKGNWGTGQHTVAVNFLNDAYGGTATTDRNLYVTGMSYDGTNYAADTASLLDSGPVSFKVGTAVPATLAVADGQTVTVPAGTATVNVTGSATVNVASSTTVNCGTGTDTIQVTAGNVTVNGSTGSLSFVGGGSGTATLNLKGGTTTATFGGGGAAANVAGNDTFTGGLGAEVYTFIKDASKDTAVINKFTVGTDHLHLSGYGTGTAGVTSITDASAGVSIKLTDGSAVSLVGVHNTTLSQLFT